MDNDKVVVMPAKEEAAASQPAEPSPKAVDAGGGSGGAGGNGGDRDLTPQQRQAIRLLAEGRRKTVVAEQIGIDRTTLHRWGQLPAFRAALEEAVSEYLEEMQAEARSRCRLALETLDDVMTDCPRGGAAVSAAVVVLRMNGLYKDR